MNLELENKLALVTGSTAGIGLAIAKRLAVEGTRVIINGRTEARVAEAIASICESVPTARLDALALDLSQADAAAETIRRYPSLDILVNNLGVYGPKPFEEITDADWTSIIETNFLSGVRLSRHYLPAMKKAGFGRVIFIASESAVNIPTEMIHYGVTKTMQVSLARGLANTTTGSGVTVNSVLVGPTMSEGVEKFLSDLATAQSTTTAEIEKSFFKTVRPSSLLQRFESVDEISPMVAFLSSPLSIATNGAAIRVEGGCVTTIL